MSFHALLITVDKVHGFISKYEIFYSGMNFKPTSKIIFIPEYVFSIYMGMKLPTLLS
jgi:hypothetical protein